MISVMIKINKFLFSSDVCGIVYFYAYIFEPVLLVILLVTIVIVVFTFYCGLKIGPKVIILCS